MSSPLRFDPMATSLQYSHLRISSSFRRLYLLMYLLYQVALVKVLNDYRANPCNSSYRKGDTKVRDS